MKNYCYMVHGVRKDGALCPWGLYQTKQEARDLANQVKKEDPYTWARGFEIRKLHIPLWTAVDLNALHTDLFPYTDIDAGVTRA